MLVWMHWMCEWILDVIFFNSQKISSDRQQNVSVTDNEYTSDGQDYYACHW
jgi:hypothetical protein